MPNDAPDISQSGFLALLDRVIPSVAAAPLHLGGSIPCPVRRGDPTENLHASARLVVQLEGQQMYGISELGARREVELRAGDCMYWAPNAWWLQYTSSVGRTFGIVMLPTGLRLIQVLYEGRPPAGPTPWSYHTVMPLAGAGLMVSRTLNCLAEEGDPTRSARELFVLLLRLCRHHLRQDSPAQQTHNRAQATWRAVRTYLDENFSPAISRESVAAALDLHPNYLSALSRQMAGQPFREILDAVRMEHARRLLRQPDLKLDRVARLCGYTNVVNFIRAFRRATGTTPGRFRRPSHDTDKP